MNEAIISATVATFENIIRNDSPPAETVAALEIVLGRAREKAGMVEEIDDDIKTAWELVEGPTHKHLLYSTEGHLAVLRGIRHGRFAAMPARNPADTREAGLREAAEIVRGKIYKTHYRTWPQLGVGDRANDSEIVRHCDRLAIAILAANQAPPQREVEALKDGRWYLGTMNDGLFIIDEPPRPAPNDTGPSDQHKTRAICGALDNRNAELIVEAHNAVLDAMRTREGK